MAYMGRSGTVKKQEDLVGRKFGRLTVLEEHHRNSKYGIYWLCLCECGTEKPINGYNLKKGLTNSCGCLRKEHIARLNKKR